MNDDGSAGSTTTDVTTTATVADADEVTISPQDAQTEDLLEALAADAMTFLNIVRTEKEAIADA